MDRKIQKHGNWAFKINHVSFKVIAVLLLEGRKGYSDFVRVETYIIWRVFFQEIVISSNKYKLKYKS